MRLYGVIDLKAGQVVHAVAGRRDQYMPIRSPCAHSARPHDVARGFVHHWGIRDAYVADLDAIEGAAPDAESIMAVADTGMRVLLDSGTAETDRLERLLRVLPARGCRGGIVVALEATNCPDQWPDLVENIGAQRAVLSIDMMAGRPITRSPELNALSPAGIADLAWNAGFRRLIALDLRSVGTAAGPTTTELCGQLRQRHDWLELISGGGVRGAHDLVTLERAGCDGALVASALHAGRLTVVDGQWRD